MALYAAALDRDDFAGGYAKEISAHDPKAAAEKFSEYTWYERDMWECNDGFEVFVRAYGEERVQKFNISIEFEPLFYATEAE